MNKYITVQGDTWDTIALKVWGNEKMVSPLLTVNPGKAHVFIFPAGVEIVVPEIETPIKRGPVPPWQR